MASVTISAGWDAGHRLPNHTGLCHNLHGHRYTAEVTISGPIRNVQGASNEGMVQDFGILKKKLRRFIEQWDHHMLLYAGDPLFKQMAGLPGVRSMPYVPTAENLAQALLEALPEVSRVKLWETPTSFSEVWR